MDDHNSAAATAEAQPNIALVKYWGKRDTALNLPAGGSISITLADLRTRTTVTFDDRALGDGGDSLTLNGAERPDQLPKISAVLDLMVGNEARPGARIVSENNFPTGAGLASSASGFAALVTAADAALGLGLPPARLSELARRGSGSAARSIFGGFVELARGTAPDGSDCVAAPLRRAAEWPLAVVIAVTATGPKTVGSGAGMELSRRTSPFYGAWLGGNDDALRAARDAIARRDFALLAEVSEASSYSMHAVMLSTRPALVYWNGATVECLQLVRRLREKDGLATFVTVDAGPQVKAVCLPDDAARVAAALAEVPGVVEVRIVGLGAGARAVPDAG